jgi:transcriptional regulator with XRE-family HTH domain
VRKLSNDSEGGTMAENPPLRLRMVGTALRGYRTSQGLTLNDAADLLECDCSKISRIETGARGIRPKELRELLAVYGASHEEQQTLAVLASPRNVPSSSRILPPDARDYFAMALAATRISAYGSVQIPELVQTPEYAAAVLGADPDIAAGDRDDLVDILEVIQHEIRSMQPTVPVTVIVGEAALRQRIGARGVMRRQIARLADAAAGDAIVTVRILPFAAGAQAAAAPAAPASVLRLAGDRLAVAQIGTFRHAAYTASQAEVMHYDRHLARLEGAALPGDASRRLLSELAGKLTGTFIPTVMPVPPSVEGRTAVAGVAPRRAAG